MSQASEQLDMLARGEFHKLFEWLSALGLVKREATDEQAYWSYLGDLPIESIHFAFAKAPSQHPRFFPTAPELREVAAQHAQRNRPRETPAAPAPFVEPKLGEGNPYGELARQWENESRDLGLDPERSSPREVARQRTEALKKLMEHQSIGVIPK